MRFIIVVFFILWGFPQAKAGIDEVYTRQGDGFGFDVFNRISGTKIFGKSYAVVIGVGKYQNFPQLDAPVSDALKVRDFLINDASFDYVITLTDEKATKERIEQIMEDSLPKKIESGDRFLFYFSGHGATLKLTNGERGYLVLADSRNGSWTSMIDMPKIGEWAENVDAARHTLFLLDACFSGLAMVQTKSAKVESMTLQRLEQPAHHIVTAGVQDEESYIYNGSSIFTKAFLEAARGKYGDVDNNIISLSQIMLDVNKAIDERRAELGSAIKMTPHVYLTHVQENFGEFFFRVEPSGEVSSKDLTINKNHSEINTQKAAAVSPKDAQTDTIAPAKSAQKDSVTASLEREDGNDNTIILTTRYGKLAIRLRPDWAPKHVAQIKSLVKSKFYDGIVFHRVIPGFMAQTGDPTGTGTGGSSLPNLPAEFNATHFTRGILGMARSEDPDSANSQFFITTADAEFLDGKYTAFGEVASGMDVVDKIKAGTRDNNGAVYHPDKIITMRMASETK